MSTAAFKIVPYVLNATQVTFMKLKTRCANAFLGMMKLLLVLEIIQFVMVVDAKVALTFYQTVSNVIQVIKHATSVQQAFASRRQQILRLTHLLNNVSAREDSEFPMNIVNHVAMVQD